MRALARLVVVAAMVVGVTACGTPRERDRRVVLPRLDEAEAATDLARSARPSVLDAFAMAAYRSAAAARRERAGARAP
jgi:hypothetical protein